MDLNIAIEDVSRSNALFGAADSHLRLIRAAFDVRISARDGVIHLTGPPAGVRKAADAFGFLQEKLRTSQHLSEEDIEVAIAASSVEGGAQAANGIGVLGGKTQVVPRTPGQAAYVEAISNNDLTICLGPAGSGKTYLAVAVACGMLRRKQIERIVLARPAVEAGERLGYLPGDLQAKVNPYLRPLFDALNDMMGTDQIKRLMENDIIEVVPLAFMRGRTLNRSLIILDEAQNTTRSQMLMFLTRLGSQSKMTVTGDDSQSDLAPGQRSGVLDAVDRLQRVKGVAVVRLTRQDIVRHPLVARVVDAYDDSPTKASG